MSTKAVIPKAKQHSYLERDKVKALGTLTANANNLKATAVQLGIPRQTLSRWASGQDITPITIVQVERTSTNN